MRGPLRWPVVIVASSLVMGALLLADIHSPLRLLVALWFMLVCTGMAFVPLLAIRPLALELALGVVLSIVLDTLVATTILIIGDLSAADGFLALVALSMVGCALQVSGHASSGGSPRPPGIRFEEPCREQGPEPRL